MTSNQPHRPDSERLKNLLVYLAILNTVLVVILAAFQSDASIRATVADRNSQYYAVKASGELHRSGITTNYDMMVLAETLKNQQESLIAQMTALELNIQGKGNLSQSVAASAALSQARADAARKFSILFSDPRFMPKEPGALPNSQAYLQEINKKSMEWVERQNQAADDYQLWNQKSDDFAMLLTIISVAFLLFGIGQSSSNFKLRLFFASIGGYIQVFCVIWAIVTLLK